MGIYLFDQISESDIAIIRNYHTKSQYRHVRRLLEEVNPGFNILEIPIRYFMEERSWKQVSGQDLVIR